MRWRENGRERKRGWEGNDDDEEEKEKAFFCEKKKAKEEEKGEKGEVRHVNERKCEDGFHSQREDEGQ